MLLKILTSKFFWGTVAIIALAMFVDSMVDRLENNITTKIENEARAMAKQSQIKALEKRLEFIVSEQESNRLILLQLSEKNQEVKVVTNEITREIIEKAIPQPIAPMSPVIADTSEALAAEWDKKYGAPK